MDPNLSPASSRPLPHPHLRIPYPAPSRYHLKGVLVHGGGSMHSGHYVAYVRGSQEQWHCCNDSYLSRASGQTVFSQQAYMLFYSRSEMKAPRTPPPPAAAAPPATPAAPVAAGSSSGTDTAWTAAVAAGSSFGPTWTAAAASLLSADSSVSCQPSVLFGPQLPPGWDDRCGADLSSSSAGDRPLPIGPQLPPPGLSNWLLEPSRSGSSSETATTAAARFDQLLGLKRPRESPLSSTLTGTATAAGSEGYLPLGKKRPLDPPGSHSEYSAPLQPPLPHSQQPLEAPGSPSEYSWPEVTALTVAAMMRADRESPQVLLRIIRAPAQPDGVSPQTEGVPPQEQALSNGHSSATVPPQEEAHSNGNSSSAALPREQGTGHRSALALLREQAYRHFGSSSRGVPNGDIATAGPEVEGAPVGVTAISRAASDRAPAGVMAASASAVDAAAVGVTAVPGSAAGRAPVGAMHPAAGEVTASQPPAAGEVAASQHLAASKVTASRHSSVHDALRHNDNGLQQRPTQRRRFVMDPGAATAVKAGLREDLGAPGAAYLTAVRSGIQEYFERCMSSAEAESGQHSSQRSLDAALEELLLLKEGSGGPAVELHQSLRRKVPVLARESLARANAELKAAICEMEDGGGGGDQEEVAAAAGPSA